MGRVMVKATVDAAPAAGTLREDHLMRQSLASKCEYLACGKLKRKQNEMSGC